MQIAVAIPMGGHFRQYRIEMNTIGTVFDGIHGDVRFIETLPLQKNLPGSLEPPAEGGLHRQGYGRRLNDDSVVVPVGDEEVNRPSRLPSPEFRGIVQSRGPLAYRIGCEIGLAQHIVGSSTVGQRGSIVEDQYPVVIIPVRNVETVFIIYPNAKDTMEGGIG